MKIVKKPTQKWQKMKLKAIVLIFRESLNYKSGVGFFVPTLEVPFFGPSKWPLLPKMPELAPQKKALPVPVQKSETTFIIQTFPKNEDYSLWFHLLSLFRVGLDDFHFRALLALISEGKSDQNEKCNFAKEGVLISKNWRKQTHLKTQFYIRKSVWQSILGTLSDLAVMSISPNIYALAPDLGLIYLNKLFEVRWLTLR